MRFPSESSSGASVDLEPIDWRLMISLCTSLTLCELGLRHQQLVQTLWSRGHVDHTFGGQIPANLGIALLDPVSNRAFLLVLAPLVLTLLAILRRLGIVVTTLQKVSTAMALQLLGCLLLVRASILATDGTTVHAGWFLGVRVLTALPGFLLYPLALSLFARVIPSNRFATMFGLWIVLHGIVNYLTVLSSARSLRFAPAAVFAIPTLLVLGGVCLWISQLRRLQLALQSAQIGNRLV